jgi:hypothetical protein
MPDNETPKPSGINVWQIMTTVCGALLIAAVLGMFTMYSNGIKRDAAFDQLTKDFADEKADRKQLEKDFTTFKEATNLRLNTVDNLKTSFDNLNSYANQRKQN